MIKKLILVISSVALLIPVFASPAHALTQTGRNGRNYEFATCDRHDILGPAFCKWFLFDNGDIKVHTEYARRNTYYEIPRPTGADPVSFGYIPVDAGNCNAANAGAEWLGMNQNFATVFVRSGTKSQPVTNCRWERVFVNWSP